MVNVANEDAVLSVGIEDNYSTVLQKMAAQTRAFGSSIGAEAKQIDKAVRQVTKSINDLNGAGTGGGATAKQSPLAARTAQLTAELRKQQQVMQELRRAEGAYQSSSTFSGWRDASGRGIAASDVSRYRQAAEEVRRLQDALNAIPEAERRIQAAQQATADAALTHNRAQIQRARDMAAAAQAETRRAQQQAMYNEMFGKQSWWPPEMFRGPQQFTESMMNMSNSTRYAMYDISRSFTMAGVAAVALGTAGVLAAARWQRAFADVERTVQGTPATLERVRQGLASLSTDLPVSFKELTEIASVGGQMGIGAEGIVAYTETIAKLTATTNLTADAASKALGRFKAFFAEANDPSLAVTDRTFGNLASSILKVGVNSVATESGIVNVSTQISSMGSYAGFTADQVIGLAGALSSVGVPPELSRGVITRLFNNIGEAVSTGGTKLNDFASLAGVSAKTFADAWGTDRFAYVFTDLVRGLHEVSSNGGDAVRVLHDLGVTSVRDVPVLLRLANAAGEAGTAGSLLAQTMNDARAGWRQNIELSLQYNKIASTLTERTKVLFQNFEALFATMGQGTVGPLTDLVNGAIMLVKGFTAIANTPLGQVLGTVTIAASLLAGGLLLLTGGAARAVGALQGLAVGLREIGISAPAAAVGVRALGFAIMGITIIGALAAVAGIIASMAIAAEQSTNAITDTQGAVAAMTEDAENGKKGLREYGGAGSDAAKELANMASQAEILGELSGYSKDQMYGAADAAEEMGSRAAEATLKMGDAAVEFAHNAILASEAYTNLFKGEGGTKFGQDLIDVGFNLQRLIKEVGKGGREAGEAYMEALTGVKPNENVWDDIANSWVWMDQQAAQTARSSGDLLNQVVGTVEGMDAAARAAISAGLGVKQYGSALELTEEELTNFKAANEDTVNAMAEGFKKFVDPSTLQEMTSNYRLMIAAMNTEDAEKAANNYENEWADAFGGAGFKLEEYMVQFRRASQEQAGFIANLNTLMARGVPDNIIADLAAMGPEANRLVQALVDSSREGLDEFVALYGATGFDSMVAMAAGQLAAQEIVRNAARTLSTEQLQQLSADLAAGTPLLDAMAKWNLDAEGKPMKAPATAYLKPGWEPGFQDYMNRLGLQVPVNPYLTKGYLEVSVIGTVIGGGGGRGQLSRWSGGYVGTGFAGGGYTGDGGKYDPRGVVHGGEFVFTKEATRFYGKENLYRMMRDAQGGRPAARPGGFAGGGYAGTGGSGSGGYVELSPKDRRLLQRIAENVGLYVDGRDLANATGGSNANGFRRGVN